jgi:hypothetical protein
MFPNAVDDKEFVLATKIKLVLKIDKHNLEMSWHHGEITVKGQTKN